MQPIPPPDAEALVPEELETKGSQKQEEEEEDLGILQYLDQLEQVTASYLSRLVLLVLSVLIIFSNILLVTLIKSIWKKDFLFLWIFVFDAYAYYIFCNFLSKGLSTLDDQNCETIT